MKNSKNTPQTDRTPAFEKTAKTLMNFNKKNKKEFATMGKLIEHLVLENPELNNTQLAKKFNLPNHIYVGKIKKRMRAQGKLK